MGRLVTDRVSDVPEPVIILNGLYKEVIAETEVKVCVSSNGQGIVYEDIEVLRRIRHVMRNIWALIDTILLYELLQLFLIAGRVGDMQTYIDQCLFPYDKTETRRDNNLLGNAGDRLGGKYEYLSEREHLYLVVVPVGHFLSVVCFLCHTLIVLSKGTKFY